MFALSVMTHSKWLTGSVLEQVTAFGESAGAIMTAILVLNQGFERLARAAVRTVPPSALVLYD